MMYCICYNNTIYSDSKIWCSVICDVIIVLFVGWLVAIYLLMSACKLVWFYTKILVLQEIFIVFGFIDDDIFLWRQAHIISAKLCVWLSMEILPIAAIMFSLQIMKYRKGGLQKWNLKWNHCTMIMWKNLGFALIVMPSIIENIQISHAHLIAWFARKNGVLLNEYGSD